MDQQQDTISLTALRADIYNRFENILQTGQPLYVEKAGTTFKIQPEEVEKDPKDLKPGDPGYSRLAKLTPNPDFILCSDEELIERCSMWDEEAYRKKWDERLSD